MKVDLPRVKLVEKVEIKNFGIEKICFLIFKVYFDLLFVDLAMEMEHRVVPPLPISFHNI